MVRSLQQRISRGRYANAKGNAEAYEHLIAAHQTPLIRPLPNQHLWLQHNKVINLKLAVTAMNGVVIKSGETFSFWRLLGKPSRSKGYVEGMVLVNGTVVPGVGGGLCQLSNLVYWATLHTPLTVIERWRHNYDVFPDADRKQPFGSGATIAYNHIDLQIRNDTDQNFLLHLKLTKDDLIGEWRSTMPATRSYRVYEKDHNITLEPWCGYVRRNKLFREVSDKDGRHLADECVAENYAIMMYQPFLTDGRERLG